MGNKCELFRREKALFRCKLLYPLPRFLGLLTRTSKYEYVDPEQKKICDAIATASIVSNCAGVDSSKRLVLECADFRNFLATHQKEEMTEEEVIRLIQVIQTLLQSSSITLPLNAL